MERSDERRQLARIVDECFVAAQRHAVEVQTESVSRQADCASGAMRGLEIDGGVSDHHRFEGRRLRRLCYGQQARRIRLAARRSVAANHLEEPAREIETLEDLGARALGLVRQYRERETVRLQLLESFRDSPVWSRVRRQPLVVVDEEPVESAGGLDR